MGLMRFLVQPAERLTQETIEQAYLSGIDRAAWPVRTTFENGILSIERAVSDSANLHLVWPLEGIGPMVFTTGSLIEREAPYLLPLELAHGTVGRLASQIYEWESIGLHVPDAVRGLAAESTRQMAAAAAAGDEPGLSAALAENALCTVVRAADQLAAAYSEQALTIRRAMRQIVGSPGCRFRREAAR